MGQSRDAKRSEFLETEDLYKFYTCCLKHFGRICDYISGASKSTHTQHEIRNKTKIKMAVHRKNVHLTRVYTCWYVIYVPVIPAIWKRTRAKD